MRLLLTGEPKSGKSTALIEVLQDIRHKNGFATKEVRHGDNRTGFAVQDARGRSVVLAQTENYTPCKVGRFYVDSIEFSTFLSSLPPIKTGDVLYIDEIGQMQFYSADFEAVLDSYLGAANDFFGTITSVYSNKSIKTIKSRQDVLLFRLQQSNSRQVADCFRSAVRSRKIFNTLPRNTQLLVFSYARGYLAEASYISLNKLFDRAILYVAEGRVRALGNQEFRIRGKTSDHTVRLLKNDTWDCDCPLAQGEGAYRHAGECSHFQAVKLLY